MNGELTGQVALVTGASYGLGCAITEELLARGSRVMLTENTEADRVHGSGALDPTAGKEKRRREALIPLGKNDPVNIGTAVAYSPPPPHGR